MYAMIFTVHTISAKKFLASCPFNKKCLRHSIKNAFAVSYLAQFLGHIDLKIFLRMGIQLKKVHNILLFDAGQFYVKKRRRPNKNLWNLFREQLKGRPIDWYLPLLRPINWYHFWPLLFFVRQSLYGPRSKYMLSISY